MFQRRYTERRSPRRKSQCSSMDAAEGPDQEVKAAKSSEFGERESSEHLKWISLHKADRKRSEKPSKGEIMLILTYWPCCQEFHSERNFLI